MSGLKSAVGQLIEKVITVSNLEITIHKLSVQGAKAVQVISKEAQAPEVEGVAKREDLGLEILKVIITNGTTENLSDEDFEQIPMDVLQDVAEQIMIFSGMAPESTPEGND